MVLVLFGPPGTVESRELLGGMLTVRVDGSLGVPADLRGRGAKVYPYWPGRDQA
jgi:hypothetical protein